MQILVFPILIVYYRLRVEGDIYQDISLGSIVFYYIFKKYNYKGDAVV